MSRRKGTRKRRHMRRQRSGAAKGEGTDGPTGKDSADSMVRSAATWDVTSRSTAKESASSIGCNKQTTPHNHTPNSHLGSRPPRLLG
jgi:hypothetical protein